jgi:hypothetical protein
MRCLRSSLQGRRVVHPLLLLLLLLLNCLLSEVGRHIIRHICSIVGILLCRSKCLKFLDNDLIYWLFVEVSARSDNERAVAPVMSLVILEQLVHF